MPPSLADKRRGCLLGQCLGDALGFPMEGSAPDICLEYVRSYVQNWFEGTPPEAALWTGQYTDDSQLARELLLSLTERQQWDPPDYARRIALLFAEERVVGRGLACDQAAARLAAGMPWQACGCPAPSAGNGSAMRAAPVGLCFPTNPPRLCQVAHEQSFITHHDRRCSAGSIAIAGATALALLDRVEPIAAFCNTLANWMRPYHEDFADLVSLLPDWIKLPPDAAVKEIAPAGRQEQIGEVWPGISPYVIPSVLWSLYSFLHHPDSYCDAVATALVAGGDIDTTAAMTGAVSGAYLGAEALPQSLIRTVNDFGTYGYDGLVQLADELHALCEAGELA